MTELSEDPQVRAIQQEAVDMARLTAAARQNYARPYPNRGVMVVVFDADRIKDPRALLNEPPIDWVDPMIRLYLSRKHEAVDDVVTAFISAHERTT